MLIGKCICGSREYNVRRRSEVLHAPAAVNGAPLPDDCEFVMMDIATCAHCWVQWLITDDGRSKIDDYYRSGAYHMSTDRHARLVPYKDRVDNDLRVGRIRVHTYGKKLGHWWVQHMPVSALDVGAANGAFVDAMLEAGHRACGVEPDPRFRRPGVIFEGGVLRAPGMFDLITYHDVLEHIVDPQAELENAMLALRDDGVIVIDVPDVSVDAGRHHFKLEHLWYFTLRSLMDLVGRVGLQFITADFPVAGKLVVYAGRA